eukprot:303567-Prymnesium_polylepis.1
MMQSCQERSSTTDAGTTFYPSNALRLASLLERLNARDGDSWTGSDAVALETRRRAQDVETFDEADVELNEVGLSYDDVTTDDVAVITSAGANTQFLASGIDHNFLTDLGCWFCAAGEPTSCRPTDQCVASRLGDNPDFPINCIPGPGKPNPIVELLPEWCDCSSAAYRAVVDST